jgi:hypothetical protein
VLTIALLHQLDIDARRFGRHCGPATNFGAVTFGLAKNRPACNSSGRVLGSGLVRASGG